MAIGYLTTNNGYDGFLVTGSDGCTRFFKFVWGGEFADALKTGADQDLDDWSGVVADDGAVPEDYGTVIAVNDGEAVTVADPMLFAQRAECWGHSVRVEK